jgi:hypothetical protein
MAPVCGCADHRGNSTRRKQVKKVKHVTNVELINKLMTHSQQGVLMQAFIIEAIAKYAELTKEAVGKPEWAPNSFISAGAWGACAEEALDAITNRNKE